MVNIKAGLFTFYEYCHKEERKQEIVANNYENNKAVKSYEPFAMIAKPF